MRSSFLALLLLPACCLADEAVVAAAANFRTVAERLQVAFEDAGPHTLVFVSGSTGKLYAQVMNGAPFDVFMSADRARPARLEASSFGVAGSRLTYALGRLAVVARDAGMLRAGVRETLTQPGRHRLAIANPASAPYGTAAEQVLDALGIPEGRFEAVVRGENVAQALTMVRTGNAALGLVALSLAMTSATRDGHAYLPVAPDLHAPIRQDALLLQHGRDNVAARAWLAFLQTAPARDIIVAAGYGVE